MDIVFMRVHCNNIGEDGRPNPGAFVDHGGGMSVDWRKYSTAEAARQRAKNPAKNGVVRMVAGDIRAIQGLLIEHRPIEDNRAHSEVLGDKTSDPEIRVNLRRIACWEIAYDPCQCGA